MLQGGSYQNHKLGTQQSIIDLLEREHEKLKNLARELKDMSVRPLAKLASAHQFIDLFTKHSKIELNVLYCALKDEKNLRAMILEGEVEHAILDKKIALIARKLDQRKELDEGLIEELRIIAEVVLHHLKEEEEDLFFYMKKELSPKKLSDLGTNFKKLRSDLDSDTYRSPQAN